MLQRGNTEAAIRLRRAKSTTSIPKRAHHRSNFSTDRAIARNAAVTAANLAFSRAAGYSKNESQLQSDQIIRSQSARVSRKSFDGFRLSRQQSSKASKKRNSPARLSQKHHLAPRAKSSFQLTPASKNTSNWSTDNRETPEARSGSTWDDRPFFEQFDGYGKSAATRLRKTQSTFAWASCQPDIGYRSPPDPFVKSQRTSPQRLSMPIPSIRENQTDEAIIALATDKYLQEHRVQQLKSKRSYIPASIKSSLRRAKRSSAFLIDAFKEEGRKENISSSIAQAEEATQNSSKANKNAITFSYIKAKWRRAFGRSPVENVKIQLQQEAFEKPNHRSSFEYPGVIIPNDANMYETIRRNQIGGRPPTPPPHLVDVQRRAMRNDTEIASVNCLGVPQYDRSRVTSWDDSTRQSTLVLQDMIRLPSIDEGPDRYHVNPTVSQPKAKVLKVPTRRSSSNFSLKAALDGRRLVSALMRHTESKSDTARQSCCEASSEADTDLKAASGTGDDSSPIAVYKSTPEGPLQLSSNRTTNVMARKTGPVNSRRSNVISPSVYSAHHESENGSSGDQSSSPAGMATVNAPQAIARWRVGETMENHKRVTSYEWRAWAADKSSGLDQRNEFALPSLSFRLDEGLAEGRPGVSNSLREKSSLGVPQNAVPRKSSGSTLYEQRQSYSQSLMNDRFPMLSTGRTASRGTLASSRRISNSILPTDSDKDKHLGADRQDEDPGLQTSKAPYIRTHSASDAKVARPSAVRNVAPTTTPNIAQTGIDMSSIPSERSLYRADPLVDAARPTTRTMCNERGSPLVRRGPSNLDDNFLLRIRKGPYGESSSSLAKANTSSLDSIRVPKRKSPALSSQSKENKENSTPSKGQQMASEFLSKRASNVLEQWGESPPAFL